MIAIRGRRFRAVLEEVERAREEAVERTILFNLCGHVNFDMAAYNAYLAGDLVDYELPQDSSTGPPRAWRGSPRSRAELPARAGGWPALAPAHCQCSVMAPWRAL